MERYLERHGGGTTTSTKEDWKDPTTAGALSRWILWNKPSLSGSFSDFKRRFGLKGTMKVSKSAEGKLSSAQKALTSGQKKIGEQNRASLPHKERMQQVKDTFLAKREKP